MKGRGLRVGSAGGMIADAADETMAFYLHIDRRGHEDLDAAAKGVDVDFLVLDNHGLAQIHTDAAAESIEAGTVEGLAVIDVLVAAVVDRAADSLAVLADGQRAPEPLIGIATIAVDDEARAYIYQQEDGEISCPGLLTYPCKPTPVDDAPDGCQFQQTGYNENNSDNRSWFHNFIHLKIKLFWVQRYGVLLIPPNFWDILHCFVINGVINGRNVTNGVKK